MHSSGGKDGVTAGFQLQTHYHWAPSPLQVVGSRAAWCCPMLGFFFFFKREPWDSRLSPRYEEKAYVNKPR